MSIRVQCALLLVLLSSVARAADEDERGARDERTGSFAFRNTPGSRLMLKRHGGSKATENSVDSGIRWLAYHQEPDGHWDAKKYGAADKTDTAVTSLALLALMGPGHCEKVGEYKDNVKRAIAWLKSKQGINGMIFDTTDGGGAKGANRGTIPASAVAALALAEAAGLANIPGTCEAAQKAVDQGVSIQNPDMEANTQVSAWFVQVLKAARVAMLKVDHAAIDGAIGYLDSVQHDGKYWYSKGDEHPADSHRLTAAGCLSRQFLGWKTDDMQASVEGFVTKGGLPEWDKNREIVDLNYWYFATQCTFHQGGAVWERWNDALKTALIVNQRKNGDDAGSWDPIGVNSREWGRVGQTALACLCLEVYYRYRQLNSRRLEE